ncbi:MAG TPA: hypothetical protein VFK89_04180 [Actinomycetota bacterium]|nr:hypothetical protein [Actinomycetota bacterium]
MAEFKRRLVERIAEDDFLDGIADRSLEELQKLRDEIAQLENEVSYERRLCQARIDILGAELDRRAGGAEDDLIARLPQILADQKGPTEKRSGEQSLPARVPDVALPRVTEAPRRRLEEAVGGQTLARLPTMPDDEIKTNIDSLKTYEKTLSVRRKRIHEVLDEIHAELVRRYATDEPGATVTG